MERDIEKLSRKILTDAILIVEDNDYLGLLIENAKTMIKNGANHSICRLQRCWLIKSERH